MLERVVQAVNWLLAIAMWLLLGRAALDWLTGGRATVIGRLFHLLTDPLYRPAQRLFPALSSVGVCVLLALLLLLARIVLVVASAALT